MGDRAIITNKSRSIGVYLHWDGNINRVRAFLKYCELRKVRADDDYQWARLCQVIGNYIGGELSLGVSKYTTDEYMDPGDNGIYVIDGWDIIEHICAYEDDDVYSEEDFIDLLCVVDQAQPERDQLGRRFIEQQFGIESDEPESKVDKIREGIIKYMETAGMAVIDPDWMGYIVANDDGELVFCLPKGDLEEDSVDRPLAEEAAFQFLAANGNKYTALFIRFDVGSVRLIGDDKGLLRYHRNCFGA